MKPTQKPIVAFDFDGTLVDKNGNIHPNDVNILQNESRAVFIPATGRPLDSVRKVFTRTGLSFTKLPFPMILQNGAVSYLPDEQLYSKSSFPTTVEKRLIRLGKENKEVCTLLFGTDRFEVLNENEFAHGLIQRFDLYVEPFNEGYSNRTKIMYLSQSESYLQPLATTIQLLPVEASRSLPTVYELTTTGVHKGELLKQLVDQMGLGASPIFAAGDGENDISLLEVADTSFYPAESADVIRNIGEIEIHTEESGLLAPMLSKLGIG